MSSPILLLHGLPATAAIWAPLVEPLQAFGPVIAPDLLGIGRADKPDIAYNPADYFRWLEDVVLADVSEPITLVAHDFGGPVGLNWAVERPERIARLVLLNTTVYPPGWSAALQIPGVGKLANRLTRRALDRQIRHWSRDHVRTIAAKLHRLTCPTLLLWGMDDRYIFPWQPHGERFLRDLPQARVAQIPDAAHFLQAEQPGLVLQHLAAFLAEAPPAR